MRRTKVVIALIAFVGGLAALAGDSQAYPPFLKAARKFGAKDCTFCHVNPEGGEPFNDRGKWLSAEKDRRGADAVDPEWLADYKPSDKKSDKKSQLEQELMKLEVEWTEAVKKHDQAALGRLLSDDFVVTDENGRVVSKTEYIAEASDVTIESYSYDEVSVRAYGDTAVVAAKWTIKGSYKGQDFSGEYRETDLWVKKGGRWQVVASHVSRVAKQ